jgi:hemoglobin/transferrin/lactoferrin receptor protein
MKKISFLTAIAIFSISITTQAQTLKGRVAASGSGAGLPGAHISITDPADGNILYLGTTGRDGSFSINGLKTGILKLSASYVGYGVSEQEIDFSAGNNGDLELSLNPASVEVGEVMVSASRQEKKLREVSLPLAMVTGNKADQLPAITPADLFQGVPGVSLARDGIWATSMNIRGLTEQRIVTLVDGNRIETATDIAAGLAMIDVNDIERIEVIKGAASSLYGTGALGGVVNIITKEGHYHDNFYLGGSATGSYQSVNKMNSENLSLDMADSKWFVRLSGTMRDAANTMTPEGELANSQFSDDNISFKAGIKPFKNQELAVNYQRFGAHDVGIPGGTAFPATATAVYPEEERNMFSAAYTISPENKALSRIRIKYFHQYILRDVELKPNPLITITPTGNHTTNGFQAQTDWKAGNNNQLIAGIDIWQRYLSTEREKRVVSNITDSLGNITGQNVTIRGEVPIPDAWFTSGGVFLQDQLALLNNKLSLTLGGRFDLINTRNDQAVDPLYLIVNGTRNNNPPKQRITFEANDLNNTSWSIDAGLLYRLLPNSDLTLTLSKAYRAPGIEERFKYIDLGSLVKIGDPALKPEEGYFADMGARVWKDKFQLSGNVFANQMTNLIVEAPGTYIYNYSANPANYDTLNALINSNVDRALLYGFDISTGYNIFDGLTLKAMAGFVRGKNTETDTDLPQIPPFNGRIAVKYYLRGILNTDLSATLVADQDKIAAGEKESKGYACYDWSIYSVPVKLGKLNLEAFGGVQNITDRAYMNHLATNRGIIKYEPGRNFYIRVRISF